MAVMIARRVLEVGLDDIIEYEDEGVLVTGIVVSLEHDSPDIVRVFEWPLGVEVPGDDLSVRLTDVPLENITAIKVKVQIESEVYH